MAQMMSRGAKAGEICAKMVMSLVSTGFMLIPTWLYMILRANLSPEGFWEKLVMMWVGWVLFGIWQIVFLVALVVLLYFIWSTSMKR